MAEAVFYDRKHNCKVKASQICHVNFVTTLARTQDPQEWRAGSKHTVDGYHELKIGELGYKSKTCRKYLNWDRWLNYSDLVFLRFE